MMPGVDGYADLRAIRAKRLAPDARILVLTAKSDPTGMSGLSRLAQHAARAAADVQYGVRSHHEVVAKASLG